MFRTVIVGASGEIGSVVVQKALERGDNVAALDIRLPEIDSCAHCGTIDIGHMENVQDAFKLAVTALGGLDVLINCAGIMFRGSMEDTRDEDFAAVIDINLGGAFRLTQTSAALMEGAGAKHIVHISSIHALIGTPNRMAYAASKGGMAAMIRAAATEIGPRGITINAVAPGPAGIGMGSNPAERSTALEKIPLQRIAMLGEVADAVMFLTSPAGGFITGHILPVDGGANSTYFMPAKT